MYTLTFKTGELGSMVQSAKHLTASPGVANLNPSSATIFVEIDHRDQESLVPLHLPLIQDGQFSDTGESMCTSTG